MTGLTRSSASPAHPCCAPAGSWVGAKSANSVNRQTERLTRLESASELTTIPKPVSPTASSVPASAPVPIASPAAPTSCPRNHTYGTVTTSAPSHSESAASSLPATSAGAIDGREQQALERAALTLAADRVGRGEQGQQGADARPRPAA